MFDAYTVKKVLPRLVIAVVLIQLSWFIFTGMISLTTAVAYGVEGLIYAPFGSAQDFELDSLLLGVNPDAGISGGAGLFVTLALAGGAAALGLLGGALSLALGAFLAILMGFALLLFRQVLVVGLLLISPLALAAWILPNTEKFWKLWWESFSKLLLVFPMIVGVIAIGRVFAYITAGVDPGSGEDASNLLSSIGIDSMITIFFIIIGFFGPYFLIPKLFAIAGSAFAFFAGMANDRSRGVFDRLKKGRGQTRAKNVQGIREGHRFDKPGLRRLNTPLQSISHVNKAGFIPSRWGSNVRTAVGATNKQAIEEGLKDTDYATWKNNDDLNRAAAETNNAGELRQRLLASGNYNRPGGEQQMNNDIARVEQMRRKMGNRAFQQMAWQQAVAGGTAYQTAAEAWRAAGKISGGDDAVLADMVANGRSSSMSAGRVDTGGAGFGDTFNLARDLRDNPGMTDQLANQSLHKDVLKSQGPGVLAHASMKPQAIKELMPEMQSRLTGAIDKYNQNRAAGIGDADADLRAIDVELANTAGVYDSLAATSPQLADEFANSLMGLGISTAGMDPGLQTAFQDAILEKDASGNVTGAKQGVSVRQLVEARRGQANFLDRRRELTREQEASGTGTPPPGPGGPAPAPLKPGGST